METEMMKSYACPSCGSRLESEGAGYRCNEHGMWLPYSANLLVLAPTEDDKSRDRFSMPWEASARPI
jgi:tRNA(Ile2) C34 agmatinyltransferase TiaS